MGVAKKAPIVLDFGVRFNTQLASELAVHIESEPGTKRFKTWMDKWLQQGDGGAVGGTDPAGPPEKVGGGAPPVGGTDPAGPVGGTDPAGAGVEMPMEIDTKPDEKMDPKIDTKIDAEMMGTVVDSMLSVHFDCQNAWWFTDPLALRPDPVSVSIFGTCASVRRRINPLRILASWSDSSSWLRMALFVFCDGPHEPGARKRNQFLKNVPQPRRTRSGGVPALGHPQVPSK